MLKVDNAVILAAGASSRFAPLSYERHKALIEVKGEVLIERQIRQLKEAGINEIYIVTGYKKEQFDYLEEKFGVQLVHNSEYAVRNNHSSIYAVKDVLKNSYICSADNYFAENPFNDAEEGAFYSGIYADGYTKEWCMETDQDGYITEVKIGGNDEWYMLGHVFWDEVFSERFIEILKQSYEDAEIIDKLWEEIYIEHIGELRMKLKKYSAEYIFEFDTLDELREFDRSYIDDTRSTILNEIAEELGVKESELKGFQAVKAVDNRATGFKFSCEGREYTYDYCSEKFICPPCQWGECGINVK
ncbi:NTP transferase domain-containing protein [Mogibacterium pumilum]|uniref:Choline-phosphate cytidylyltransferase n=1 Tax=Mogibacterium pumilum TaxID=86332 RepID=A0A223AQU0_9FIRM|nr:NTP transferase domain-containing protein [Mogibacterium pumilum]ASS37338.1 choline-phosphate cytidylyltransferase [Mogibacterium pumilum]